MFSLALIPLTILMIVLIKVSMYLTKSVANTFKSDDYIDLESLVDYYKGLVDEYITTNCILNTKVNSLKKTNIKLRKLVTNKLNKLKINTTDQKTFIKLVLENLEQDNVLENLEQDNVLENLEQDNVLEKTINTMTEDLNHDDILEKTSSIVTEDSQFESDIITQNIDLDSQEVSITKSLEDDFNIVSKEKTSIFNQ